MAAETACSSLCPLHNSTVRGMKKEAKIEKKTFPEAFGYTQNMELLAVVTFGNTLKYKDVGVYSDKVSVSPNNSCGSLVIRCFCTHCQWRDSIEML